MKQLTKIQIPIIVTLCAILLVGFAASVTRAASDKLMSGNDRKLDEKRCETKCRRQQPYFEEHLCMKECLATVRDYERRSIDHMEDNTVVNNVADDAEEEYERCQERCHGTGMKQWHCQRTCQDEYEAGLEREKERSHEDEDEDEDEHGDEHAEHKKDRHDHGKGKRQPQQHDYKHCIRKCEDREEGFPRQRQCKLQCEEKFGHQREHHKQQGTGRKGYNNIIHNNRKEKESNNPFYFDSKSFESRYSTEEGHMKVLQRFSEKSELLLGIDRFRVGFYEVNPNSFMLPHHWDADSVLFVIKGKATMTFLKQENSETFNLKRGDVLMIPAGTIAYLISTHKDEKLEIAELLRPVNTPGRYEQFFGVGGGESNSFFSSFSKEILQAALNVPKDQLEKFLKQQKEGAIVKASDEQIKRMAHGITRRQFGSSKGPFNLLDKQSEMSNEHGEFYEVTPNDYHLLEDLDVSVAYCDIKQGSMMAPNYNSRTTYVVVVEEGSGYFEVACPHLGNDDSNKKHQGSSQYRKVRSGLSKGDVFVIPAGHPVALLASENEGIRAIGFGINAENNQRNFLTGQENIMSQLDEDAMELSFNVPAEEVKEMFRKQKQSYFMAGPRHRKNAVLSLLDFADF